MNTLGPPAHSERPRIAAFGGAKGGVGRSTVCSEIARSLARSGSRVLCIDASLDYPSLNTQLHAEELRLDLQRVPALGTKDAHIADLIVETGYRNVWLAQISPAQKHPFVRGIETADEIMAQVHELDFDWVFIDLPPGCDTFPVSFFIAADVPILVSSPEPAAIRATTQFLRASLYQAIGFHPRAFDLQDDLLDTLDDQRIDLNRESFLRAAPSAESRKVVVETLERFETYLIVNMVREGAERDLGHVLSHALFVALGTFPRYLGSVDFEDRRWFYNRRTAGQTSSTRGEEALSSDIEHLARYINDLRPIDLKYPRPAPRSQEAHPALRIGLAKETGRNEIRQACRRLWEGYRREASISLVFSDPERRLQVADQLENTYRNILTLQSEPVTKQEIESAGRDEELREKKPTPADESGGIKKPAAGKLISSLRRQRQMTLQELSLRSHIGLKYLAAIESGDLNVLPRQVYLRGYLREISRVFGVEPDELIDQYFRFLDEP